MPGGTDPLESEVEEEVDRTNRSKFINIEPIPYGRFTRNRPGKRRYCMWGYTVFADIKAFLNFKIPVNVLIINVLFFVVILD